MEQELDDSDIARLKDLLIRSEHAESSARKALCIKIGIEPNSLSFLTQSADDVFALLLISYLHDIDNKPALCRICKELEVVFKGGKYFNDLSKIKSKLNCEQSEGGFFVAGNVIFQHSKSDSNSAYKFEPEPPSHLPYLANRSDQ